MMATPIPLPVTLAPGVVRVDGSGVIVVRQPEEWPAAQRVIERDVDNIRIGGQIGQRRCDSV